VEREAGETEMIREEEELEDVISEDEWKKMEKVYEERENKGKDGLDNVQFFDSQKKLKSEESKMGEIYESEVCTEMMVQMSQDISHSPNFSQKKLNKWKKTKSDRKLEEGLMPFSSNKKHTSLSTPMTFCDTRAKENAKYSTPKSKENNSGVGPQQGFQRRLDFSIEIKKKQGSSRKSRSPMKDDIKQPVQAQSPNRPNKTSSRRILTMIDKENRKKEFFNQNALTCQESSPKSKILNQFDIKYFPTSPNFKNSCSLNHRSSFSLKSSHVGQFSSSRIFKSGFYDLQVLPCQGDSVKFIGSTTEGDVKEFEYTKPKEDIDFLQSQEEDVLEKVAYKMNSTNILRTLDLIKDVVYIEDEASQVNGMIFTQLQKGAFFVKTCSYSKTNSGKLFL
jgi:hypothetical protein